MKTENAIEVSNITKNFKVYYDKGHTLKEKLLFSKRRAYEIRKVLDGISFEVKQGEAIGLIGHNGCGKSTTLKLLTRIMYPDSGNIEMRGRVSSLIELGAGFHPDMSGRENIYINASIFGLTKKEIDKRLDDIIAFSELEEFIDNPVRTYSSGMYMRLAFSVAINVDADILLIDEILAVGDVSFQAKCFDRLKDIKAQGTTIVIVSHSLGQIEQICERSIWINDGKIVMEGEPRDVHPYYLEYMGQKEHISQDVVIDTEMNEDKKRFGNKDAEIVDLKLLDGNGQQKSKFAAGESVKIQIHYSTKKTISDAVFGIGIFDLEDKQIFGTNTLIDRMNMQISGSGVVECVIDSLSLGANEYKMDVAIHSPNNLNYDYWKEALHFKVYVKQQEIGLTHVERSWLQYNN